MSKSYYNEKDFMNIINPYIRNKNVAILENIPHHKISNRLEHSIKVSYIAYKMCKRLKLKYKDVAIAGILHDLYYSRIDDMTNFKDKVLLFMNEHPKDALENSKILFELNNMQKNMILSHMWPISKYFPKYRESIILGIADKIASVGDFVNLYKLKFSPSFISVYFFYLICNFKL